MSAFDELQGSIDTEVTRSTVEVSAGSSLRRGLRRLARRNDAGRNLLHRVAENRLTRTLWGDRRIGVGVAVGVAAAAGMVVDAARADDDNAGARRNGDRRFDRRGCGRRAPVPVGDAACPGGLFCLVRVHPHAFRRPHRGCDQSTEHLRHPCLCRRARIPRSRRTRPDDARCFGRCFTRPPRTRRVHLPTGVALALACMRAEPSQALPPWQWWRWHSGLPAPPPRKRSATQTERGLKEASPSCDESTLVTTTWR